MLRRRFVGAARLSLEFEFKATTLLQPVRFHRQCQEDNMYTFASTAGGGAMVLPYPVDRMDQAAKAPAKPANDEQAAADEAATPYQNGKKSRA